MLSRIIVHAGLAKTGTTSLQSFLINNAQALAADGIAYPHLTGDLNHRALAAWVQSDNRIDDLRHGLQVFSASDLARFRRQVIDELDGAVASLGEEIDTLLFSSEHLHSHLCRPEEVQRLHSLLSRYDVPINVIFYLRRQDRLATSLYSTHLKTKGVQTFALPSIEANNSFYNYETLLHRWADVFGGDRMRVAVYDDIDREGRDFIDDFMKALGVDSLSSYTRKGRANVSISQEGQRFLRSANLAFASLGDDTGRIALVNLLVRIMPGKGELPAKEEAREFLARYADANERVRNKWTPERPVLFDEDFDAYPDRKETVNATVEETVAFAKRLRDVPEADPVAVETLSRLIEVWGKGEAPID